MSTILVCGSSGMIGHHLVKRLKRDGHTVYGIDRKLPEFEKTPADQFNALDLREQRTDYPFDQGIDEVYQLAAEVGGLGYIMDKANDAEILHNSMRINLNVLEACRVNKIPKVFFASSACVYPSIDWPHKEIGFRVGLKAYEKYELYSGCRESDAYPLHPDNEYAYEKAFAERLYAAYARGYGIAVRIGRFHNCFGTLGTYKGGREKAPAAICRKVAEAEHGTAIEVWGDGTQTRSFMYVDDAVEGAIRLMASDFQGPVNIGSSRMITVQELCEQVIAISSKWLTIKYVDGPVGVLGRNSDNALIKEKLGWEPHFPLEMGLFHTYHWVRAMVQRDNGEIVPMIGGKTVDSLAGGAVV